MKLNVLSLIMLGSLFFLGACTGNTVKESTGRMRIMNASYNSGGVNIDVDYKPVYNTLTEYLNYSLFRDYISGRHPIQVRDAGGNIVLDTALQVAQNGSYTLVIFDSSNSIRCRFVQENFLTPVGSSCKVRFLHLSNDAPAVDIFQETGTVPVYDSFSRGMYSEYYSFGVKQTYFTVKDANSGNPIYTQSPFDMQPGYFYTLFLKGNTASMGTDSLGLFVIGNNGEY